MCQWMRAGSEGRGKRLSDGFPEAMSVPQRPAENLQVRHGLRPCRRLLRVDVRHGWSRVLPENRRCVATHAFAIPNGLFESPRLAKSGRDKDEPCSLE